jgi:peptide/nickel transport system ATP-binding protein
MRDSMKDVGLRPNELLGRYPHQLSGGERQRFMLARILAIMPKIIVADEPISMIDVSLRSMFLNKLLDFKTQHGISSIFITHDLTSAYYLGGNVMILCRGRILEKGDMESVVKNPAHPYTKMLIDSIPASNPKNRWTDKIELKVSKLTADSKSASTGCVFYYGCEHCIERCLTEKPPMYETSSNHLVACFLHA